jgi:hypothetical protein
LRLRTSPPLSLHFSFTRDNNILVTTMLSDSKQIGQLESGLENLVTVIAQLVAKLEKGPEFTTLTEQPWVLPSILNTASEGSHRSQLSPEPAEERTSENARQSSGLHIKPATPNDFLGDHAKGRAFLNSCNLYIGLAPTQFVDNQAKIRLHEKRSCSQVRQSTDASLPSDRRTPLLVLGRIH